MNTNTCLRCGSKDHWDERYCYKTVNDETETIRRILTARLNAEQGTREALESQYGQVWSTDELRQEFDVKGFMAPYVIVRRKSDGAVGSLMFQHSPRFYFGFQEDKR